MPNKSAIHTLFLCLLLPFLTHAQIKLERRSLLNGKIDILVPDYFKPMTADAMAQKYPNPGQQPDLVLTDADAQVNLVISRTRQAIQPEQMGSYKDFMINSLKGSHPGSDWLENGVKTINGKKVGYFKMVTKASDQKVFVFYFFTDLDGKVAIFTFNCIATRMADWKNAADEMMASLKVK